MKQNSEIPRDGRSGTAREAPGSICATLVAAINGPENAGSNPPPHTPRLTAPNVSPSSPGARPAGSFFVLQGMMARLQELPRLDNPHPRGSAERTLWLYGWKRRTWPKWDAGRNASCETDLPNRLGRGQSKLGQRTEYSPREDRILELCFGWLKRSEIADILGRTPQSVANRANRLGLQASRTGAPGR